MSRPARSRQQLSLLEKLAIWSAALAGSWFVAVALGIGLYFAAEIVIRGWAQ